MDIPLSKHIALNVLDVKKIDNYNRKSFITRYNEVLQIVAHSIAKHPDKKLHEKEIRDFIEQKFFLSEVATRRYLRLLKGSAVFVYNEEEGYFLLPENVVLNPEE
jgi:hypothetical protein